MNIALQCAICTELFTEPHTVDCGTLYRRCIIDMERRTNASSIRTYILLSMLEAMAANSKTVPDLPKTINASSNVILYCSTSG